MGFIELFFHKRPEEVTEDDVQNFITQKIQENLNLEYKDIRVFDNSEKLSITVSSFANAEGGLFILGIGEKDYLPEEITWCELSLKSKEALENRLLSKIHPRINNLSIIPVIQTRNNKNGIYLIDIPQGDNPPYIAGDKRYYKRINFQKIPMEGYEISDFFGRRKRPKLILDIKLERKNIIEQHATIDLKIGLKNIGKSVAKNALLHFEFVNCKPNTYSKTFKHGGIIGDIEILNGYFSYPLSPPFYPHPEIVTETGTVELYCPRDNIGNYRGKVLYRIMAEDMPTKSGSFKILVERGKPLIVDNYEEELSDW